MALAATRTSGTYSTLFVKSAPTTRMPAMRPSSSTSRGERPAASASRISDSTSAALPS